MSFAVLLSVFEYLGDFFGKLSGIAMLKTGDFISFISSTSHNGLPIFYKNIVTGLEVTSVMPTGFIFDLLRPIITIFSWLIPEFVYTAPLFVGVLVGSIDWFLLVSIVKFFKGLF